MTCIRNGAGTLSTGQTYDTLGPEFELARSLIQARIGAGLTQAQLAERMNTTQSVVARLESGHAHPSTKTLERIARSTGTPAADPLRAGQRDLVTM